MLICLCLHYNALKKLYFSAEQIRLLIADGVEIIMFNSLNRKLIEATWSKFNASAAYSTSHQRQMTIMLITERFEIDVFSLVNSLKYVIISSNITFNFYEIM